MMSGSKNGEYNMYKTGEVMMFNPMKKEVIEMKLNPRMLFVCSFAAAVCVLTVSLFAAEHVDGDGVRVERIAICKDVQDRVPIDMDTTFSADAGSLYCFTRIEGATDTTSVTHVWYYGEKKMAEVTLPVRSIRWRTWSNKRLLPRWTGTWTVVILSETGTPLTQTSFLLTSQEYDGISQLEKQVKH